MAGVFDLNYLSEESALNTIFTNANTTANMSAGINPPTINPGVRPDAIYTRNALITIENKPSVRILTGSVNKTRRGFKNKFNIASTMTTSIDPTKVTSTPGTSAAVMRIATAEIRR
jgi:hypothetical protein